MRQVIREYCPEMLRYIGREFRYMLNSLFSRRRISRILKRGGPPCLEIGAGNKKGTNGWVTLDMAPDCDIYWDLLRGLPFPDGSVKMIYSSHVLEHFSFTEIIKLLEECRRVLVSGGIISVCVPNARLYAEAYVSGKEPDRNLFFRYAPAYNGVSSIDYLNYTAYMGGLHKHMFDEKNLLQTLEIAGFAQVRKREFDAAIDLRERDFESIYAEARK